MKSKDDGEITVDKKDFQEVLDFVNKGDKNE